MKQPFNPDVLPWRMATASTENNIKALSRYLKTGYSVNAKNEQGETAFSYACSANALESAKYLHAQGADINTIDTGNGSPLDWAVQWSSEEFCDWLISVGGKRNDV